MQRVLLPSMTSARENEPGAETVQYSFEEAAAVPVAAITALQGLR